MFAFDFYLHVIHSSSKYLKLSCVCTDVHAKKTTSGYLQNEGKFIQYEQFSVFSFSDEQRFNHLSLENN